MTGLCRLVAGIAVSVFGPLAFLISVPAASADPLPTVSISVDPASIMVGASATLAWSTADATACSASGSWSGTPKLSGTKLVTPSSAGTKTYTLTCTGSGGSASASAALVVDQPPPSLSFGADQSTITLGDSLTLNWASQWTKSCTATGAWSGAKALSGSELVTPTASGTLVFTLKCYGSSQRSTTQQVSVAVISNVPPTVNISIDPAAISIGDSATVAWSTSNASSCTASGSWKGTPKLSGTKLVTPTSTGTKTYTLSCTGTGGSTTASAALAVSQPAPVVNITADQSSIILHQSVTVSWTSQWTNSCTAQGDWSGAKPLSGSETITPTKAKINVFRLKCFGSDRRTTLRDVSVTVESGPFGLSSRPVLSPLGFPSRSAQPGDVAIVKAFPNLNFNLPIVVTAAPGDQSRMFVATQEGLVYAFANDPAVSSSTVFLDLRSKVSRDGGELGLLGLSFDPDYANTGWIYVNYNPVGIRYRTRISRFTVSSNPNIVDPASELVMLEFDSVNDNHKAGWIGVGADGKVYTTSGDGGDTTNGQNLGTLLGKMVRLNKDGTIPSDNPFVNQSGARGEIWAYGFRNPFRASFDRGTGAFWVGDVGSNSYEEIDLVTGGGNYGWGDREGRHGYPTASTPKPPDNNYIDPVVEYDHGVGCSVIGGNVYRGSAIPALFGQYVFSDYCSSALMSFPATGEQSTAGTLGTVPANPSSFGEDASGELYITGFDGYVYKLVPGSSSGGSKPFPQLLSQTGLFSDTANLVPNPGLIEYEVRSPLWSDGARKRRWVGLPNSGLVGFTPEGAWNFPVDTVTVKHFEMKLADGTVRRMETRVFVNFQDGWQGYTYRWNADGSDADLVPPEGATENILTPAGTQLYVWPSRTDCMSCHNSIAGRALGLRTIQVNRTHLFPNAVTDNQLRAYNHVGLFNLDIGDAGQYQRIVDPSDTTATLADRARSYLDVNCSMCHQPGGPTPVDMDLRVSTATADTRTINVPPSEGDLGITGALRLMPGNKEMSVLWQRMNRLDASRMPPLASHLVDQDDVDLIGQWIDSGAP